MEHQILLRFSDGETRPLTVGHGGNLLEAALNSGLALLNQCKTGSCSTCVCKAAEGDLRIEANTSVALIPSEIASGTRLSCVTKVYSDGVVELPYEVSELDRDGPTKFEGEIVGIERLNDSVVHLSIDAPDMPGFEAGEYFTIKVPGREVSRAYSPSTRPAENPSLEFLIRLQPNGAMSGYLAEEVCEGDVLSLEGPFGEFKWNKTKNPIIFVAGGTGLAPVLSMLNTISVERRHRERILLCFGVNKHNELFYQEELDYLQQMMPRLEVRISVVEPSEEWDGPTGHVTGLITESDVKPNTEAFLCGPPPMVAAATELLKGFGLDANAIKAERFFYDNGDAMMEQIEQWIQKAQDCFDKEEFRGLINDMVNIPSPTGEELQIAQYCTDYLQKSGLKPELQMISGTQANAIGRYGSNSNSDGPELLLFANVDTHMGAIEEDKPWIGDPYPNILKSVAKWNGDIISGLGSENPKGYAASMMTAAACIAKAGVPLKGNLTVGLGAGGMTVLNRPGWDNKYIGAGNGALFMLQRSVTPDYCIFGKPGYYACWEEVGVCFFRVRLKGPGLGYAGARHILPDPNPIPHVARVIDAIEAWIPQYAARNSSGLVEPWGGISVINGGWPGRPLIAPAAIDLIVDLRLSPRSTVPDVLREFRSMLAEVAKDIPRLEIDVSIDLAIPGGHTPPDNWIVKSVISAWEATENKTHATPPRMSGYTDISVIRRWGIPAVRVGMPFSPDMIFGDEHNEADILPMNRMDINHAEKLVKLVIRSAVQTCMKSIEETRTS